MEPGICRLPALLGAARGAGGGWDRGRRLVLPGLRGPQAPEAKAGGARREPGRARRGRGQFARTPSPGPRRPRRASAARRIPQFPLPRGGPLGPGLTCPSAGHLGVSQTGAGRVGEPRVIGLWLGGWLPGRPGVVRAIPEKVCRAGLGEQRAGGGPGVFADLFVTQSLLPGVSKAELQASPGRERTWGRGRRGRVSVRPRRLRAAPRLQARAAVFH